jgi:hypothetical protein
MFIKFKDSFVNMDQIAAVCAPDNEFANGVLLYVRGGTVDLEPGEYEALSNVLLAAGSINLAAVASPTAAETYKAAAGVATFYHFQQTQEMVDQFRANFEQKGETRRDPQPSEGQAKEFRPEPPANPLPTTLTNRPGVFPDPYEDL